MNTIRRRESWTCTSALCGVWACGRSRRPTPGVVVNVAPRLPDRTSLWQPEAPMHWTLPLCSTDAVTRETHIHRWKEKVGTIPLKIIRRRRGRRCVLCYFISFAPWCSVPAAAIHQGRKQHLGFTFKLYSSITRCFTSQTLVHIFVGRSIPPPSELEHL